MRNIYFTIAVAVMMLYLIAPSTGLKCRNPYIRRSQERAAPFGYCWTYVPGNRPISNTLDICNRMYKGRLPAINTLEKAKKLAEFTKLEAGMYESGELGTNWGAFFRNGNKGTTIWLSPMHAQGGHMVWNETDYKVAMTRIQKGEPHHVTGSTCAVFSSDTLTWEYADCPSSTKYPFVCEEAGHGNDEADKGTGGAAPAAPAPAPAPKAAPKAAAPVAAAAAAAAATPSEEAGEDEEEDYYGDEYYDEDYYYEK